MDNQPEAGRGDRRDAVALRPAGPADEAFLYQLYASTREEELAAVDFTDDEREAFLRMQFDAQRTHYRQHYPRAEHSIILRDGADAGRIWVERNEQEIRILDMALLPAHRGAGVGSHMLKRMIAEARSTARPLRHSVEKNNPAAKRLYERLGFVVVGELPTHFFMEHAPEGGRAGE